MGAAGNKKPKKPHTGKHVPAYEAEDTEVVTSNKKKK